MKHINNYSILEEANNGVNFSPNVSLIENQLVLTDVGENKPIEFKKTGDKITGDEIYNELTFKGKDTENSVQLKWTPAGLSAPSIAIEVSINNGDWRPYEITSGTGEVITLADNDTVKFRGNNETLGNVPPGPGGYWQFVMTGVIEAHGNIMSLFDKTCEQINVPENALFALFQNCSSLTTAPQLPATSLAKNCYNSMFSGCTSLTSAPELPATVLADYCYSSMFSGCMALVTTPLFNAITLGFGCYKFMFSGCTGLINVNPLETVLSQECYCQMFYGCTSLVTAPELPATTLTASCYDGMFQGCTSLVTAPELPATTLTRYSYRDMFKGCELLKEVIIHANDISADWCLQNWLANTAQDTTGTLHSLGTADFTGQVPENWTIVQN